VRKKILIILNYSMDSSDPIFSHQLESAVSLSKNFNKTIVITSRLGKEHESISAEVHSTSWVQGKNLKNAIAFYATFFKVLGKNILHGQIFIFAHMTEVQSALIAPLTRLLGIRHFLWYAHASKSKYLSWCNFWVNGIITSTKGSCPIDGKKVHIVGQAISSKFFNQSSPAELPLTKLIHIGRFDPSKNLEMILKVVDKLHFTWHAMTFLQVGGPSNSSYQKESDLLQEKYKDCHWAQFAPSVPREMIPDLLRTSGCFIHAFSGSLDKTLLEATAALIPVVTINNEYLQIFGSWQGSHSNFDLESEYLSLASLRKDSLRLELERRRKIVEVHHSLKQWSDKITTLIINGNNSRESS